MVQIKESFLLMIDSHCHLDFAVFDGQLATILAKCQQNSIKDIIIPGVCAHDWQRLLNLCDQYTYLHPALGLHPCFLSDHQPQHLQLLAQICQSKTLCAIGEIGLDFYHKDSDRSTQNQYFSEQLDIAEQYHLPVLIHARKSHEKILNILNNYNSVQGIIHAYSGSYEQAKRFLDKGFKLGFGGAYTYPKAHKLRSLVNKLPLHAWVLETDAPDMTPSMHFGKINQPYYLNDIAKVFLQIYNSEQTSNSTLKQIELNTITIFPHLQRGI